MVEETVQILSNAPETAQYHRLTVRAPAIAPRVQPGQFVHLRIPSLRDALLRRPFSVFQARGETILILYKTVGKGTEALALMRTGETLSAIGPLGRGFTVPGDGDRTPVLVAGGYGMAALYLLAERSPIRGVVCVGGRHRVDILCEDEFRALGWEVRVATEDGSHGERGLVTQLVVALLRQGAGGYKLFACGPTAMLQAVSEIAATFGVPAEVSLDSHMGCGVGACLTCVVPVKRGTDWEYRRVCADGPVFDASQVCWELMR